MTFGRLVSALAVVGFVGTLVMTPGSATVGAQSPATPTFSKDVAPILYKNCVACHRPGEMAPMSLFTYENVRPYVRAISAKVSDGSMPPWHATQPVGVFKNDRRLTSAEKATILAWANGGAPEGNPRDLPVAPTFTEGWRIGKPDLVISMPRPFTVPAEGTIAYQNFELPTNFTEDKWIEAMEVRAGTPAVVHHVLVFCSEPDKTPRPMPFRSIVPGAPTPTPVRGGGTPPGVIVGMLAPNTNPQKFEPGQAMMIRKGAVIRLQVHYTANHKEATDLSSVGFIFAKQPPRQEVVNSAFLTAQFAIPAGADNHRVDSAIEFTTDAHIIGLVPHTHLRGKSWEYHLIRPDGTSQVILSVPKYDFGWQTYYEFAQPLAVAKGSRIEAIAHYDNSTANKSNPDPKIEVHWGDQTWEEMQYTAITYTVDDQKPYNSGQQD